VPTMENAVKIDTSRDVLRIDIDLSGSAPVYAIAKGTAAPKEEDANLRDEAVFIARLKSTVGAYVEAPKVRIAAHGDLSYEVVERIMKELDRLRNEGQINEYHIEVNERAPR